MLDSSKNSRIFSKRRVLILVVVLVFILGYSLQQVVPANSFTTTVSQTEIQTRTQIDTTTIYSNSNYSISSKSQTSSNAGVGAQSVVATLKVESGPVGVAYDSTKGEIFVTDFFNNTVSVISDATNAIVATVGVGNNPVGVAYDSSKGEVFVADFRLRYILWLQHNLFQYCLGNLRRKQHCYCDGQCWI